jgi:CelD/BcsL family acetyltransferase involved in cellulose biosynthesis
MSDLVLDGVAQLPPVHAGTAGRSSARHKPSAEVIAGPDAYHRLRADWDRLTRLQRSPTLFQHPDLLAPWAQRFAGRGGSRLATVVLRGEDGEVFLIWPLVIERTGLARIARGAGAPFGQYDDILLDPAYDGPSALAAAIEVLDRTIRPDLLSLERVRADSALRTALGAVPPLGEREGAPYADLSAGAAAHFATLKSRVLQQQRKRARRFEQEGAVGFEVAQNAADAERWIVEAMEIKHNWLRETGRVSRAFAKPELADLLADYARGIAEPGRPLRLLVSRLTLDGRTAAVEVGFCHRDTYHVYLGAFAANLAKFGPGNILTEKLLLWCAENGMHRYDMLAPRSRNKAEWQSGEVEVSDFALATSWFGRFYLAMVVQRLMPAARSAFYRLPAPARSAVAALLLRGLKQELGRLNRSAGEHDRSAEPAARDS